MDKVKVTITAKNPKHEHQGKPVKTDQVIEVSPADAEFLLQHKLISTIPSGKKGKTEAAAASDSSDK